MRDIGKNWEENNLAELLVLIGGAMSFYEKKGSLEGYSDNYLKNKDKDGYHYRMQKLADKKIMNELRNKDVRCSKWKVKRYYRYKKNRIIKVDNALYDYFQCVMDYILGEEVLTELMFRPVLEGCKCREEMGNEQCLNKILDWQYQRLNGLARNILNDNQTSKEAAENLLNKFKDYLEGKDFMVACTRSHMQSE